jgi:hypothetical protein
MAFSLPAYKCLKTSAFTYNNKLIMRYECLTVKGLDVAFSGEVARKTGVMPLRGSLAVSWDYR